MDLSYRGTKRAKSGLSLWRSSSGKINVNDICHWKKPKWIPYSSLLPYLPFFWKISIVLLEVLRVSYDSCVPGTIRLHPCGLICSSSVNFHQFTQAWLSMTDSSKPETRSFCLRSIHLLFWCLYGLGILHCCSCLTASRKIPSFNAFNVVNSVIYRIYLVRWNCVTDIDQLSFAVPSFPIHQHPSWVCMSRWISSFWHFLLSTRNFSYLSFV